MQIGNRKLFIDKALLSRMLNLRRNGYSIQTLAIMFNCHFTSIDFECQKYHIEPLTEVIGLERLISDVIAQVPAPSYKIINGEKINLGKSYKEYVAQNLCQK